MNRIRVLVGALVCMFGGCSEPALGEPRYVNVADDERMLLVLSAPSIDDPYYEEAFEAIVDFQIDYARAIMGNDNVIVVVDDRTKRFYEDRLPEDVILRADVLDIWMRDFSTVNPLDPVRFRYTWASMEEHESVEVQRSFERFAAEVGLQMRTAPYLLDGGNLVDNYAGAAVTTTRFLNDNGLTHDEGMSVLMDVLKLDTVAILPPDEEVLAHSDGMVSWLDEETLLVNDYSADPEFRSMVLDELYAAFPDANIVEVPVEYGSNPPRVWEGFESACGVNLNATVTFNAIYVPVFGMAHEEEALALIRANTSKTVVPVNARGVCGMGGSVRCLTWQLAGENAALLIEAARER